ncbi:bacteriohemerythrin [Anaerocolumna chitinilytica]|uniref:Hemerythrin n=1 Tax=Anaerocolumna chitinilytica TaxID=1727145 RepID=A0A7M3S9B4_9FIRM|nr:hemerythrin family protein [Anaerocolumna chitinilytica]BCK01182.1 hemerythrin [Anaerocolumna chitinilytica]
MYEMKPEYYIGVDTIDNEHAELFRIANDAYELVKNDFVPDKFDDIVAIILKLKEYTKQHFADEEAYMLSIGYKRYLSQKAAHDEFIEKINGIDFESIDHNQTKVLLDILDFLNDWLVHHIVEKDKLIGTL